MKWIENWNVDQIRSQNRMEKMTVLSNGLINSTVFCHLFKVTEGTDLMFVCRGTLFPAISKWQFA